MSYTNRKSAKMLCAFKSYEDLIDFGGASLSASSSSSSARGLSSSFRADNCDGTQSFYGIIVNTEDYHPEDIEDDSLNNLVSKFNTVNPETVETVWNQQHSWGACFDILSSLVMSGGGSGVLLDKRSKLNKTGQSIENEWPTLAAVVAAEAEAAVAAALGGGIEKDTSNSGSSSSSSDIGWSVTALASSMASALCISSPSLNNSASASASTGAPSLPPPMPTMAALATTTTASAARKMKKKAGSNHREESPASDDDWEFVSSYGGSGSERDRTSSRESRSGSSEAKEKEEKEEKEEEEEEEDYEDPLPLPLPVYPIPGAGGRSFRDALLTAVSSHTPCSPRNIDEILVTVGEYAEVDPSSREGRRQSKALRAALLATAPYRFPSVVVAPPEALQSAADRSGGRLGLGGQMRVDRQYMFDYEEDPDFVTQNDEDYFCSSEYSKGMVNVSRERDAVLLRPQVLKRKLARLAHLTLTSSAVSPGCGKVAGSIIASKSATVVAQLGASVLKLKSRKNERSSAFKRRNTSSSPPDNDKYDNNDGSGAMLLTEGTRSGRYARDVSSGENDDDDDDCYTSKYKNGENEKNASANVYASSSLSRTKREAQRRRIDATAKRKSRKTLRLAKLVANSAHCDDNRRSRALMYLLAPQQQEQDQ